VRPTEAEVIATDAHGRPAILERRVGEGRIVLCTYPLEHFGAARPRANPEETYRIYRALRALAGIEVPVDSGRPDVLVDSLLGADGTRYVWAISESAEPVVFTPVVPDGATLERVLDGTSVEQIELQPYGVEVFRLSS
jgi:hypothetical protein